jgi:hypothetical protein
VKNRLFATSAETTPGCSSGDAKGVFKQAKLLERDLRHPSFRAKKYDEALASTGEQGLAILFQHRRRYLCDPGHYSASEISPTHAKKKFSGLDHLKGDPQANARPTLGPGQGRRKKAQENRSRAKRNPIFASASLVNA